jgi:isopenicillin N synthase-like dioxygenase
MSIPTIDLAGFTGNGEAEDAELIEEVRKACESTGFFILEGHGIDLELLRNMESASWNFFRDAQPAVRQSVAANGGAYGYFPLESESLAFDADAVKRPDLREAFSMGPPHAAPPGVGDELADFLFQRTPFPDDSGSKYSLKEAMQTYYTAAHSLSQRLLTIFALALSLPEDFFASKCHNHASSLRAIHYPPHMDLFSSDEQPSHGQSRCGAHTDTGTLTILWQSMPGLEVLLHRKSASEEGVWVPVECSADQLVVNIGDLFQRWTNDRWLSTVHRVGAPTATARLSVPFFHILDADAVIESLGGPLEGGRSYEPITQVSTLMHEYSLTSILSRVLSRVFSGALTDPKFRRASTSCLISGEKDERQTRQKRAGCKCIEMHFLLVLCPIRRWIR